jgi:2-methylcitrate dehydratase PrpD
MHAAHAADLTAAAQAEFVRGLKLADVPQRVQERALHLVLDTIGCAMAARREDFAVRLAAAIGGFGHGEVGSRGVIGFDRPLPLRDAIWLNGALMHGLDYDDTHMAGVLHLSVGVLPAVLGLGAQHGASGAAMLAAYIAGLETGARVASVVKGGLHTQGFHPTGVVGTFAAALAAGHLLGLTTQQLVAAQGIALSMAGGSLQFLEDGAWTKRLHPGWAAQAGVQAAWLAAQDIPAPTAPYEGRFGLFHAYLDRSLQEKIDLSLAQRGLGAVWELEQIAIKPFPMCHFVHAAADAAIALNAQGVRPEQVVRIDALMPAGTMPVVCDPIAAKRRPQTDYDAKFSLPYAVASGLMRGRLGLRELQPEAIADPAAAALMDRVFCETDPDATFPRHYGATLRVSLRDGRVLVQREPVNRGHAERPLSNADIQAKYRDNAALHFGAARAEQLRDAILQLPSLPDLRQLERLLAREPEASTETSA